MTHSRRQFMIGCSAAVAALAGSRVSGLSFAEPSDSTKRDIVVVIFLRGGMDGLHLAAPVNDRDYIAARSAGVRIGSDGDTAGLPLKGGPKDLDFRLHPAAKGLKELYDSGHLAIVHACGLTNGTRSHFEAMDLMERGVAEMKAVGISTGWLARHLASVRLAGLMPAVCTTDSTPVSLLGSASAAAVGNVSDFSFYGDERQSAALHSFYQQGDDLVRKAGARTITAVKALNGKLSRDGNGNVAAYQPENGAMYADAELSSALQTVARVIKMDLGLEAAAVDFGGWDTHQGQNNYFPALIDQLSSAIATFYNDMSRYQQRITVVVMSEFGRRLKSNQSEGTDHGHGNAMLVLGGSVNGGRIHGRWPGLATEQLDDRADLAVTTDYRTVLAELLSRRLSNPKLSNVFPGLKEYQPLGIFKGADVKVEI